MTINNGRCGTTVNYHNVELVVIDATRDAIGKENGNLFRVIELRIHDGDLCRTVSLFGRENSDDGEPIDVVVRDKDHEERFNL